MKKCEDCGKIFKELYMVQRLWADSSGRTFGKPSWVCNNCAKTKLEIFPDKIRVYDSVQGREIKSKDLIWQ